MNQTHVLYIFDNHLLHPLKNQYQVSPDSFSTKAIAKGNNCLLPSAATAVRIAPLYLPVKNALSMQMTGRQCGNTSMQDLNAERPLQYLLSRFLGTWIRFQVVVATRISKTYSVQQCRHIVIRSFIRPPPHLQRFLFRSVSFVVTNFIFKLLLNSTND